MFNSQRSARDEVPTEGRSALDIASGAVTEHFVKVPGMEPIRRSNRSYIQLCEQIASLHILDNK